MATRLPGNRGGPGVLRPPGLKCQRGDAGGQLSRTEPLPDLPAQALGREQVELRVDAGQHPPVRGHLVAVQVAEVAEQRADAFEGAGDHVRPAGDAAVEYLGLAFGPQELIGLPGVRVGIRAAMARMFAQAGGAGRRSGPVPPA